MYLGVVFAIAAGLMWAGNGVVISRVARHGKDPIGLMAMASLMSMVSAWIFIPHYGAFQQKGLVTRLPQLILYMAIAGSSVSIGYLFLQSAMRKGHHGATFAICQSALVFPFVVGVIFWNSQASIINYAGVAAVLLCLVCLGMAKGEGEHNTPESSRPIWFALAMIALVLTGAELILKEATSTWQGWEDHANIRVPLSLTAGAIVYQVLALALKRYNRTMPFIEAIILTVLVVPSQLLIFRALDIFDAYHRSGLGWPTAISTCIVSFSLYSIFVLKEPLTRLRLTGILFGIVGVVLVAIKAG
jgi:drug/metabolite transporter (DMT)-like permease